MKKLWIILFLISGTNASWAAQPTEFFSFVNNPTLMYLLLMVAFYGLFFELMHPGHIVPGVIGSIALIIFLYAMQSFAVNHFGLALIVTGLALMVFELFIPTYAIAAIVGTLLFLWGSFYFVDLSSTLDRSHVLTILFITIFNLLFFYGLVSMTLKSRKRQPITGQEALVGKIGLVSQDFTDEGEVSVLSEKWRARAQQPLRRGQRVKVVKVEGLTLWVEPDSKY